MVHKNFITYIIRMVNIMALKLLKNIAIVIWALGTIALSCMALSYAIDIPYHDMMRIFTKNEYFWFDGRHIAYLSAAPFLTFLIFILLIIIFSKDHQYPQKLSSTGTILAMMTLGSLLLLNTISALFYLYIILFTSFKPCTQTELNDYYVIDDKICNTIEPHTLN